MKRKRLFITFHFIGKQKEMEGKEENSRGSEQGSSYTRRSVTVNINENEDVKLMKQSLLNESSGPELLPFPSELIERVKEQLQNQKGNLDVLDKTNEKERLQIQLYTLEIERVQYVLNSFLRARLDKILSVCWSLKSDSEEESRFFELCSTAERAFAEGYKKLVMDHLNNTLLNSLPTVKRDVPPVGVSFSKNVIIRVLKDIGDYQAPGEDELLSLQENDIYLMKYKSIRSLLLNGQIMLI